MTSRKLVIVESPAKCKKIESLLGKGYQCIASFGHIYDLPENIKWFSPEHPELIQYVKKQDKSAVISNMRQKSSQCDEVIIATDLDREGEGIGYNISQELNLNVETTKRIVFDQITKNALEHAVNNPQLLRIPLIHAQQARRVIDQLYGFLLSPIVSKAVQQLRLSAGRCQSPCLRMILEKQEKYTNEQITYTLDSNAELQLKGRTVINVKRQPYPEIDFTNPENVNHFLNSLKQINTLYYHGNETKPFSNSPPMPLITSTLQTGAFQKYKWSPKSTMSYAQKLYEGGYITYMRTDCYNLSPEFVEKTKKEIAEKWGEAYIGPNRKVATVQGAQEAHEAIRPVDLKTIEPDDVDVNCVKLYRWIYSQTLASLMSNSEGVCSTHYFIPELSTPPTTTEEENEPKKKRKPATTVASKAKTKTTNKPTTSIYYTYTINTITFPGFKILSGQNKEEDDVSSGKQISEGMLEMGMGYAVKSHSLSQGVGKINKPLNPAETIKALEKNGIGRPSTYSGILERLEARGYVEKDTWESQKVQLTNWEINMTTLETVAKTMEKKVGDLTGCYKVTDIGKRVIMYMETKFSKLIDYEFTKKLEIELDNIAQGLSSHGSIIGSFYQEVMSIITVVKRDLPTSSGGNGQLALTRVFIETPEYKLGVVRIKSDWVYVKAFEDKRKKWMFAKLEGDYETVTEEDALKAFEYPKLVGIHEDKELYIKKGPHGAYLNYGTVNVSLSVNDGIEPNLERAIEMLTANINKKKENVLKEFNEKTSVRKGPYGRYICILSDDRKKKPTFVNLPESVDLDTLTLDGCMELVNNRRGSKRFQKSKATIPPKSSAVTTTAEDTSSVSVNTKKPRNIKQKAKTKQTETTTVPKPKSNPKKKVATSKK